MSGQQVPGLLLKPIAIASLQTPLSATTLVVLVQEIDAENCSHCGERQPVGVVTSREETKCSDGGSQFTHSTSLMDLEETQTAVVENCSQRRKESDFTKELMEGAAQAAVGRCYAVTSYSA